MITERGRPRAGKHGRGASGITGIVARLSNDERDAPPAR
jgi:hypothetical protein